MRQTAKISKKRKHKEGEKFFACESTNNWMNVHVNVNRVRWVKNKKKNIYQLDCGCPGNSAYALGLSGVVEIISRIRQSQMRLTKIGAMDKQQIWAVEILTMYTHPSCCTSSPPPHGSSCPSSNCRACHVAYEQCRQKPHRLLALSVDLPAVSQQSLKE